MIEKLNKAGVPPALFSKKSRSLHDLVNSEEGKVNVLCPEKMSVD